MTYLKVIEQEFSHSDYVAFLRGSILKLLLEDKPLDIAEFNLYTDKLSQAMDEAPVEKIDVYRPTVTPQIKSFDYTKEEPTVDPDEPRVQPKHKFKLGDRVIVKYNDLTGTIIRLPTAGFDYPSAYVVELDDKTVGWIGSLERDGVQCKNGWFASEENLELINEATLQTNKWYHTTDFTVEELQALLPSGTTVEVEAEVLYDNIDTTPPTNTKQATVEKVTSSAFGEYTYIDIANNNFSKEWFKIIQED